MFFIIVLTKVRTFCKKCPIILDQYNVMQIKFFTTITVKGKHLLLLFLCRLVDDNNASYLDEK